MPAPSLQGIPSVVFPIVGGASRLQTSPFGIDESIFSLLMPENFSYPRVQDDYFVFPIQSIFPMHTDPPNLPPSLPVDWTSPIVGHALGFDTESDTHCM